jgi:aerobic-type carbon monoxide dehydrogenase small subunit (CoxS/CutS family)
MSTPLVLHVNGSPRELAADPSLPLLYALRDDLDLTGTKYGCGEGQCGACTVLVDGVPVRSCVTPLGSLGAGRVATIEGLERDGALHPVQQAFLETDALQCGYCTPGMIMAGVALLARNPDPTDAQIAAHLEGNLCRCGCHPRIVAALRRAAQLVREARS